MASRYLKSSTQQSPPFNNSSNDRLNIKFDCGKGNAYNLQESYLLVNCQPDGVGTNPTAGVEVGSTAGVWNFQFGDRNGNSYLPSCIVENVKVKSGPKGVIESNIKRNALVQTMLYRTTDAEQRSSMIKYGMGNSVNIDTAVWDTPFLTRAKTGATASTVKPTDVIIPLSDLCELGKNRYVPWRNVGPLELELELENNIQIFTDYRRLTGTGFPHACADQDTNALPRNTVTLSADNASVLDVPFTGTTDQKVIVHWTSGGNAQHAMTTIAGATDFTIAANKVTMTLTDNVLPATTACTAITISTFDDDSTKNELKVVNLANLGGAGKVLTTFSAMLPTDSDFPFYVGQMVVVNYVAAGATAVTTRKITTIAVNGGDPTKTDLTVDGTATIPACGEVYVYQSLSKALEANGSSPRITINRVDLVYAQIPDSGASNLVINKIAVEPYNLPNTTAYFERIFRLDSVVRRELLCYASRIL